MLSYQGFAYDSGNPSNPTSGHNTPSKGRASSAGGSTRKPLTSNTPESPIEHREHFTPKGHFAEGSTESKHRFYQHQSHWDDFDDQSPVLHSSSQIPSQAVALVEDGLGCIVDVSNSKLPLEKLAVPEGLLFSLSPLLSLSFSLHISLTLIHLDSIPRYYTLAPG